MRVFCLWKLCREHTQYIALATHTHKNHVPQQRLLNNPPQNKTITTYTPSHPAYYAQRLLDPKYYGHDRESMVLALSEILYLGCRFVVGGRMEGGGAFLTLEVCGLGD